MTAFDDPVPLNTDVLINHIYQAQADLKMLVDWLAYEATPELSEGLLLSIVRLHTQLDAFTPTARH